MEENYEKSKSRSIGWFIAAVLAVVLIIAVLPAFIRARSTSAMNPCINTLRQIAAAKQQWALENSATNLETIVTWEGLKPYLSRGATGTLESIYCPGDKTKQYSNSYTLGNLNTKPKCKIYPSIHLIN